MHWSKARIGILTILPALNAMLAMSAFAQPTGACSWIGGATGDWHTAGNWDCDSHGGVPTADDTVTIVPAGAATVTLGADASAWSLTLGTDDGAADHSNAHTLRTTADDIELAVGMGGVTIAQTGFMQLGQHQLFGIGSQPPLRATLSALAPVVVHGRLWPRNARILADVVLQQPGIGGARGQIQARGWNEVHGRVTVTSGFLQSIPSGSGHFGSPAPHFLVADDDLFVESGSSVQIFVEVDGGVAQPAIAVSNGVLDHRGVMSTSGFAQATSVAPVVLDATVINSGMIRTRLTRTQGLAFRGPANAVHENSGSILLGYLSGAETEADAVDGFGLLIEAGRTLANSGDIMIHRLRDAEGEVLNFDGGLISDSTDVAGPAEYILGFAGPQQVGVSISDAGTIERLDMIWFGEDHPAASLQPMIAETAHWWALAATSAVGDPASGMVSLALPQLGTIDPRICRHHDVPAGWECLPTSIIDNHVVTTGLTTVSGEWALADAMDFVFFDGFELIP